MLKNQKFGVEIEMTGVTREQAANIIGQYFGTFARYNGGTYQTYQVNDSQGRAWKTMYDGSISTEGRSDAYKCELVTPPLKYEDIETLQEIVRLIRQAGGKVNSSCGIHIHVDGANHTAKSLVRMLAIMNRKQKTLNKVLKVFSGRKAYCRDNREEVFEKSRKISSMDDLKNLWYDGNTYKSQAHYDDSRYQNLNLHSMFYRGTVEFRMFNSTLHAGRVKAYIQLCLAISAMAIKCQNGYIKEVPEQTCTRAEQLRWLNSIGLKGEEFETVRKFMTENLE